MNVDLSQEQKNEIAKLKEEWKREVAKIEEIEYQGTFCCACNKPYQDLEKKYTTLIQAVISGEI